MRRLALTGDALVQDRLDFERHVFVAAVTQQHTLQRHTFVAVHLQPHAHLMQGHGLERRNTSLVDLHLLLIQDELPQVAPHACLFCNENRERLLDGLEPILNCLLLFLWLLLELDDQLFQLLDHHLLFCDGRMQLLELRAAGKQLLQRVFFWHVGIAAKLGQLGHTQI